MRARVVVLLLIVAACTRTDADAPVRSAPEQVAAPAGPLSDPQIAAIVVAANQVDIDSDRLALEKTRNEEVRKLAEMMITDHTALTKSAVELATKLGVTPDPTDASRGLTLRGAAMLANLEVLDGDAFDRAYVNNEVEYHKAVIGLVWSTLIPSATHPDLRELLRKAEPLLETHLQHAQHVQAGF